MSNNIKKYERITEHRVKQLYWKYAKGYLFSKAYDKNWNELSKKESFQKMELSYDKKNQEIRFDGTVYEALHYGFHDYEYGSGIEPQLSNFLDVLVESFPNFEFELLNYYTISIIEK